MQIMRYSKDAFAVAWSAVAWACLAGMATIAAEAASPSERLAEEIEAARVWVDAMFARPGTEVQPRNAKIVQQPRYLDESAPSARGERRPSIPISFVYDGQQCEGVPATWNGTVTDTAVRNGVSRRTLSCDDPDTGLRIECEVTTYADSPAVDWVLYLANQGVKDTPLIEQFLPLSATLLPGEDPITLRWSNGDAASADAFLPHTELMQYGRNMRFCPVGGRSSNGGFPFFNVMGRSGGWVLALGWSGQWLAAFEPASTGGVMVRAGMEKTKFRLHPGERVRTPRIVLLRWHGDAMIRGHNLFRQLMLSHYVQRRGGQPAAPPVAHATAATVYQTGKPATEANQLAMLARAADLGCEAFWLDAYWYPQPWHLHVGDWFPRQDDFPRGLSPLSKAAHQRGMRFILWFEPERVREGTQWDREHPEFLLKLEGEPNRLFNLADASARAWLIDFIDARTKEWSLDVYRQDFNMDPLAYWRSNDANDRQGITEMKHVEGLYAFWDALMARNPGLTIDNCASGGRRIDVESCSRSYPLWRSDCNDIGEGLKGESYWPYMGRADQIHGAGLSLYIPFHAGPVWDERPYIWRSATASGVVLYGNIEDFSAEVTSEAVDELKALRPFFLGDIYPLRSLTMSQEDWYAYQLDRPDLGEGCALFFRRPESPQPVCDVELQNIDASKTYEVSITGETYRRAPATRVSGADLRRTTVRIPEKPGSAILRYKQLAPAATSSSEND